VSHCVAGVTDVTQAIVCGNGNEDCRAPAHVRILALDGLAYDVAAVGSGADVDSP